MGWLDVAVAVALVAFGGYLVGVLVTGGGSVVEVSLVVVLTVIVALRWIGMSFTVETIRDWRRRRR